VDVRQPDDRRREIGVPSTPIVHDLWAGHAEATSDL